MVDITLVELHVEDASFSAAAPFSGLTDDSTADSDSGSWLFGGGEEPADESSDSDETDTGSGLFGGEEPADETSDSDTTDGDSTGETDESSRSVPTKAIAALGGLVALVAVAALVKYLRGGDDPDVEIETAEDSDRPVGVTVDDE
jgi:hypothetical protein